MNKELSDLLAKDELDVIQMAQVMSLPKGDFLRMFGDHEIVSKAVYIPNIGIKTYRFILTEEEPRVYYNQGYAPPLP